MESDAQRAGLEESFKRHVVLVVGAGPAGAGAAQVLLESGEEVVVVNADAFYGGFAEYGIFVDKDGMRSSLRNGLFPEVFSHPRVHYFGGVSVGRNGSVTLDELRKLGFSAVVLAVGAGSSNPLNIPGEKADLPGLYQAHQMVAYYEGRPSYRGNAPQLGETTLFVGNGNVTVDITNFAIHQRDYQAVDRFLTFLAPERRIALFKKLAANPKNRALVRNLWVHRARIGRTVRTADLETALIAGGEQDLLPDLQDAWEKTPRQGPSQIYWATRRGPEEKAFEPGELETLAPYVDLRDLRLELRRISGLAPDSPWTAPLQQRLLELLLQHPKTKTRRMPPDPQKRFEQLAFGSRLDKAQIRMRFFLAPHEIQEGSVDGMVFERTRLDETRQAIGTGEIAGRREIIGESPLDSIVVSTGNRIDPNLDLPLNRRGLLHLKTGQKRGDTLTADHFTVTDESGREIEGLFAVGWARQPSEGKVGIAREDGRKGVGSAVARTNSVETVTLPADAAADAAETVGATVEPYLQQHSDLAVDLVTAGKRVNALRELLRRRNIPFLSAGEVAAVQAFSTQAGFQPESGREILRAARRLDEQALWSIVKPGETPQRIQIFAHSKAIPPELRRTFERLEVPIRILPDRIDEARAFLAAQKADGASGVVGWINPTVEPFEQEPWDELFRSFEWPAIQLAGASATIAQHFTDPHWAAFFSLLRGPGLHVILGLDPDPQTLYIYV